MSPPAATVVITASSLFLSRIIPTIPTIKAAGNENIASNPPRVTRGLPQPGRSIVIAPIVRVPMMSNFSAILLNRIS